MNTCFTFWKLFCPMWQKYSAILFSNLKNKLFKKKIFHKLNFLYTQTKSMTMILWCAEVWDRWDSRERLSTVLAEHGHHHVQHDLCLQETVDSQSLTRDKLTGDTSTFIFPVCTLVRSVAVHSMKTFLVFKEIFEWSPKEIWMFWL